MAEVLVYSEKDAIARELLSGARGLGLTPLSAAILGPNAAERAQEFAAYGAVRVYVADDPALADFEVEPVTAVLEQAIKLGEANTVLLGSTKRGKELAGRLAQRLGAGCITDAIALRREGDDLLADRYALGGNTVATERINTPVRVISLMPKTFEAVAQEAPAPEIRRVALELPPRRVMMVERRPKSVEAVDLEAAEMLVGVGKGLEKKEDLSLIYDLARALRAEVGCTRALASEYQWLSEERLIGLSGKKCKPRLYVAVGISGQIQHTVGIAGARLIVAINKDKDAPIFKLADYGIVGDLYQVVPQLTARLAG